MRDIQNAPPSCSNKGFEESFEEYQTQRWDVVIGCPSLSMCILGCASERASARVCVVKRYLALATHSMIASFLPMVTLVFLGGMMIAGATGSAGPPTSMTPGRKDEKVRKSTTQVQISTRPRQQPEKVCRAGCQSCSPSLL